MRPHIAVVLLLLPSCAGQVRDGGAPPNIVIILTDDQGYADVGCFGAKGLRTPNLDRMAAEGMRFSDFYVAQAVCTASRAALMTGCYPNRVGLQGALNHQSLSAIHEDETLARTMNQLGPKHARGHAAQKATWMEAYDSRERDSEKPIRGHARAQHLPFGTR